MELSKPVIVFVHGAWHTPRNYQPYFEALTAAGFRVFCPYLPTCDGSRPPKHTFQDDVAAIRQRVQSLVAASERVILVMHSYGGAVGSNALQDLSFDYRTPHGLRGGVIHLVYMCALILPVGSSIMDVMRDAGRLDAFGAFFGESIDGTSFPHDPVQMFFGGLTHEEIERYLPCLVRFPMNALEAKATQAAWLDIPFTYLFTKSDCAIPHTSQQLMIDKVKTTGRQFTEEHHDTSHSVFLTRTDQMVKAVQRACGETVSRAAVNA